MVVKIRLARFGRTNAPFYNIVIAHARYVPPEIFIPFAKEGSKKKRERRMLIFLFRPQDGAEQQTPRGDWHVRPGAQEGLVRHVG